MAQLTCQSLIQQLATLSKAGKIRPLDYQFARFIAQFEPEPLVVLAAALVSYQSGQGDVCVWLDNLTKQPMFELSDYEQAQYFDQFSITVPILKQMKLALSSSTVQGQQAPLIVDQQRLYLQRYWNDEQFIYAFLAERSQWIELPPIASLVNDLFAPDFDFIIAKLDKLRSNGLNEGDLSQFGRDFFNLRQDITLDTSALEQALSAAKTARDIQAAHQLIKPADCVNWQQIAVSVASSRGFSVISGGPGTGKTTTVTKLLALLVQLHSQTHSQNKPDSVLNIELVAPTGKAAARLTESITGALADLNVPQAIKSLIPNQASTIHRLLGVIPKRVSFKHNRENPLHLDVLIVDEASMIDISLMAKLLEAVPTNAKIIFLGDKDQLASVEAGAVFADICQGLSAGPGYSNELNQWLTQITGSDLSQLAPLVAQSASSIGDSLCLLQKSYRFGQYSGIGQLASAVNNGDIARLNKVWQQGFSDIGLHRVIDQDLSIITQMVINGYQPYLKDVANVKTIDDVARVLELFNQFQLLSPLRKGKTGIEQLNHQIESRLNHFGLINLEQGTWYSGRPIMIQENDHQQQLFNGDIGMVLPDVISTQEQSSSAELPLRVYFKMANGEIKSFLPSRLPRVDTVYAMTIHKSQGSEFNHVVMVLPQHWGQLLTKELIYTGITRAKSRYDLFASLEVLEKSTKCQTKRSSGLAKLLTTA
ncbi:MAG: exodeoxyribonuclease V subunit alpha [Gammaproteobacteria bacterium]|nr:exodeoxyribonuclease V subunit alpha [Gammaproteobacteria bacterium]